MSQYSPPPPAPQKSNTTPVILGVAGGAAVAALVVGGFFMLNGGRGATTTQTTAPVAHVAVQSPATSATQQAAEPNPTITVTQAAPAPEVVVVQQPAPQATRTIHVQASNPYPAVSLGSGKECSRDGSGPYAAVGTTNSTTTCGFARNVRQAYLNSGINGGYGWVTAYSPTTKEGISMQCSGSQPVQCTGGRAARVVIYGGPAV